MCFLKSSNSFVKREREKDEKREFARGESFNNPPPWIPTEVYRSLSDSRKMWAGNWWHSVHTCLRNQPRKHDVKSRDPCRQKNRISFQIFQNALQSAIVLHSCNGTYKCKWLVYQMSFGRKCINLVMKKVDSMRHYKVPNLIRMKVRRSWTVCVNDTN